MTTSDIILPTPETAISLTVHDLGRAAYAPTFERQLELQREVIAQRDHDGESSMHLMLVEHDPPVITVSRRPVARDHLLASTRQLEDAGVTVAETNRGGDITYHGPGQLVVYPILDLNVIHLRLHTYMRWLEQIVIDVLKSFGVEGHRDHCATGVWVGEPESEAKICAMGVRVSRWVTMHGLALNVATDLAHFDLIVPCGLTGRRVTSLSTLLGDACPTMDDVKAKMIDAFRRDLRAES
ncbi:MAG: lipoyl(octanoyl) transferase LipB [Planctomycetota bacterium]